MLSCAANLDALAAVINLRGVALLNQTEGAEVGKVMRQVAERNPSLESFTADTAYKRQAERTASEPTQRGTVHHRQAQAAQAQPAIPPKWGGVRPIALRWRIIAPLGPTSGQCRLLSKEDKKTIASAEAWLWCAMTRVLVRRLDV